MKCQGTKYFDKVIFLKSC